MPSDVQQSAHLQRAQSMLVVHPNVGAPTSDDIASGGEKVYEQRYHALRNAGFSHETANKYKFMYSSVNEVIDTILSQSLIQQLAIEGNNSLASKSVEVILSSGKHQSAILDQCSSATNLQSIFAENLCLSKSKALFSANDTVDSTHDLLPSDLIVSHRKSHNAKNGINHDAMADTDHLSDNDHFDESDKTQNCANYFNGSSFETANRVDNCHGSAGNTNKNSLSEQNGEEARLRELLGFNLFNDHELNGIDQLTSICDLVEVQLPPLNQEAFKATRFNDDYSKMSNNNFDFDCVSGIFNKNLLATVLKDGLFDPDDALLEDEGVGADQNVASMSPSASSSLSSSGASSLQLDSSSPSSFSSLSSSISNTPPDALNGFESVAGFESAMGDSLFGFHCNAKHLNGISLSDGTQSKFTGFNGNGNKFDGIDLTRETVNNSTTNDFEPATELGGLSKSFLAYNETCFLERANSTSGQPVLGSAMKNSSSTHGNFSYADLPLKYPGENIFPQPYSNGDNELLFEGHYTNQLASNFADGFGKFVNQSSDAQIRDNLTMPGKTFPNDDSTELLAFMNSGSMRQHSLYDYEQCSRPNDSFGFRLDKINKSGQFDCKGNDLFAEYAYRPDAYFGSAPTDAEMLCSSTQSPYSNDFLNQRTFADIAASNVISSGTKVGENCLGAIGDCKSPKSNSMSCSNLNLNNLNSSYFNLFANNGNTSGQNAGFYDQQNLALAKKSFCGQTNNFRTSLSPISSKVYSSGAMINEQINFAQQQSIRANMPMNAMLSSSGNSSSEMITTSCDGSSLNKPTNLMAYKGLWVCNISPEVTLAYLKRRFRRFGHFTGIQTFERRATNGSNIVFVHYDNPYSPVEAISCLHNYTGQDLCADQTEPLKLRFAPSMEQSRAGQLPTLEQARKMVERHGECFNYRLSSGCHRGIRCQLKHVPINKEIDSQPWVKALKKKNADM